MCAETVRKIGSIALMTSPTLSGGEGPMFGVAVGGVGTEIDCVGGVVTVAEGEASGSLCVCGIGAVVEGSIVGVGVGVDSSCGAKMGKSGRLGGFGKSGKFGSA